MNVALAASPSPRASSSGERHPGRGRGARVGARGVGDRLDPPLASRRGRNTGGNGRFARRDLVAHPRNRIGGRPDKDHPRSFDRSRESGIFRQESIARMDGVRIALQSRHDDPVTAQITLRRGRRPEVTLDDGAWAVKMGLAAQDSALTGQAVRLD